MQLHVLYSGRILGNSKHVVVADLEEAEIAGRSHCTKEPNMTPIDFIDYWAVGTLENGCFLPISSAFRSIKAGKLPLSLSAPNRECLYVQIVDSFGKQGFWAVET
jgi:hypothetical protein